MLAASAGNGKAATPPGAVQAPGWPDTRFHRLAALALLEELRGALLSESSATLTLEHWCAAHRLAGPEVHVVAERDASVHRDPTPAERALLAIRPDEAVGYRHVRLSCGGHLLSEADNWYVPGRLTAEMNHQLDATDVPFGRVVMALKFTRTTLSSHLLWSPLPPNWVSTAGPQAGPSEMLPIPPTLIENRALLRRADGQPFSLVIETYQRGLLDFAAPPAG